MTCSSTIREGHDHGLVCTPCGFAKAKTVVLTLFFVMIVLDVVYVLCYYFYLAKSTYHVGTWTQGDLIIGLNILCAAILVGLWTEIWLMDKPSRCTVISWSVVLFLLGFRHAGPPFCFAQHSF